MDQINPFITFPPLDKSKYLFSVLDKMLEENKKLYILCLGLFYKKEYLHAWLEEKSQDPNLSICVHSIIDRSIYKQFEKAKVFRFNLEIPENKDWGKHNNIHETSIEFNLDKDLPLKNEYNVIINFHLLHHSLNWRLFLTRLLPFLTSKGAFVFSDIDGTYSILDGDFKTMPQDKPAVYRLLKDFDNERNGLCHYWRPEISLTNYSEFKNQVEFLFDEVIDHESVEEITDNQKRVTVEGIVLNEYNTLNHLFQEPVYSYFHIGITSKQIKAILTKIENTEALEERLCDIVKRKDQIYICNSFNKEKFKKIKVRHWNYNSLLKDLDYIKDNNIQSLGRKAIDLFASHDIFFPGYTRHLTLMPWEYETTERWSYPLHLLYESKFKDHKQHTAVENLLKLYILTQHPEADFFKLFFKESNNKFPLNISIWNEDDFTYAARSTYTVVKSTKDNRALAYNIHYTRKGNIGQIDIAINRATVELILLKNELFIDWFDSAIGNDGFVKKNRKWNEADSVELKENTVVRRQITESEILDYSSIIKIAEAPAIEVHSVHNDELCELRSAIGQYDKEETKDLLDRMITLTILFQLQEEGHRVSYIPSSIIRNKKVDQEGLYLNGLGGVILYEKLPENEAAELESLISARDNALQKAVFLIFYKASIASYAGLNFQKAAMISAVSAIAARSGAHTLGSHVLPEVTSILGDTVLKTDLDNSPEATLALILSANKGQGVSFENSYVSDFLKKIKIWQNNNKYLLHNKELFKYLQERIDFIAQFASDFPQWSLVMNFIGDVLKNFYQQYHILNCLGDTEGISAYEYKETSDEQNWFIDDKINEISDNQEVEVYGHFVPVNNKLCIVSSKTNADQLKNDPLLLEQGIIKAFICEEEVKDSDNNSINSTLIKGFDKKYYGQRLKLKGKAKKGKNNLVHLRACSVYGGCLAIKARLRKYLYLKDNEIIDCLPWSKILSDAPAGLLCLAKATENEFKEDRLKDHRFIWGVVKKIEPHKIEGQQFYRIWFFSSIKKICIDIDSDTCKKMKDSFTIEKQKNNKIKTGKDLIGIGTRIIIKGQLTFFEDNWYKIVSIDDVTPPQIKEISIIEYLTTTSTVNSDINYNYEDIQIAIPGGTIGTQAFYIILENIIRNSAKHSWIKLQDFYKKGKNLEIKIELEDHENYEYYVCKIWSNATDLRYEDGLPFNGEKYEDGNFQEQLITHIKKSLEERIIEENGKLIREHLGLSEMKICAAFLAKHNWPRNGILSGSAITLNDALGKRSDGFIRCSSILEEDAGELVPRLGYRIKLLKLKEIVILGHPDSQKYPPKDGVNFINRNDKKRLDLDYEFCVLWHSSEPVELHRKITEFVEEIFNKQAQDMTGKMEELSAMIEYYPCRLFLLTDKVNDETDTGADTNSNWNKLISNFNSLVTDLQLDLQSQNYLRFLRKRVCFINSEMACKNLSKGVKVLKAHLYTHWYQLFLSKEYSYQLKINLGKDIDKKANKLIETVPLNLRLLEPIANKKIKGNDKGTRIHVKSRKPSKGMYSINYQRHQIKREENDIYNDPLSGGSKIYSVIKNFLSLDEKDIEYDRLKNKLVESGLASIMILDERVFNYVAKQKSEPPADQKAAIDAVYNVYLRSNILVPHKLCIDGQTFYEASESCVRSLLCEGKEKVIELVAGKKKVEIFFVQSPNSILSSKPGAYNVNAFVIHQSILDHMSKGLFPEDHLNSVQHRCSDKVVFKLKHEANIPCIIITSGKGKLSDSNRFAKYIPFANISELLLRPDPDKFTLTQTLLQSLNLPDQHE